MDTVRALRQSFLFKDVPEPILELVARATEEVTMPAGAIIASEGDRPDAMYIIGNGTVRASVPAEKTPPVMFGPGQMIGAASFVDGERAGMEVVALERVDLLVLRASRLTDTLAAHPDAGLQLYRAIAKSLAGRLRRAVGMIAFAKERQE